jgi:HD-GYP domain-containing protein (c-di-GMP phosphodiesterase class II)
VSLCQTVSKPESANATTPTLAEILEALSHALDMTEGQPRGHSARTCLIAQRIGREIKLAESEQEDLFYAALLKDSGCSANSARIHQTFGGDELATKHDVKFIDWSKPLESAVFGVAHAEPGAPLLRRVARIARMAGSPTKAMDSATGARCDRGARIAARLGFSRAVSDAIFSLDEHWDGQGSSMHLRTTEIPLFARILCLAQTLELFASERGLAEAFAVVRDRSGRWFDPDLVRSACSFESDSGFWALHAAQGDGSDVLRAPDAAHTASPSEVDEICSAFADIVDAKSSFTGEHSQRVTSYAVAIGTHLGLDANAKTDLRRASLLHDIGKLGVPNSILDKPGRLDPDEFERVKLHPKFTFEILSRVRGFKRVTEIACAHHERLDGKGYWLGLTARDLDTEMRILAVADVYDALSAKRPYRDSMPREEVMKILRKESETGLDPLCVEAAARIGDERGLDGLTSPVPQ